MKDQKVDKQQEVTVLVELFSTFIEKVTYNHPDKEILNKNLSKFKNFLYGNQQNLEKGYDYLEGMKEQFQQHLTENYQLLDDGLALESEFLKNQIGGQNTQQNQQLNLQAQNIQIQQEKSTLAQQYGLSEAQLAQIKEQQSRNKVFNLDLSKLSEKVNLYKVQQIQDFNVEGINYKQTFNGSGFSLVREFIQEENGFYRCVGFRYLEQIIKSQNITKLQDVLKNIQIKKIQLKSNENEQEQNQSYNLNTEMLAQTFCGYLEYILENLQRKDRNELQETLYKIINGDRIFDRALISYIKEQAIRFIQESDSQYISFLLQNQEVKNDKQLIQHIRSSEEPFECAIKIVTLAIESQINVYTIQNDNSLNQKSFKLNQISESNKNNIDVFKLKTSKSIYYYIIYNQNEGIQFQQQPLYMNQQPYQQSNQYIQQQQTDLSNQSHFNNQIPKQQSNQIQSKQEATQSNVNENSRPTQVDDLKIRGGFLKKMLKMFDDNTEDLINKMSSFKDGQNEDEEDEKDEENIEKVLKEQINSSKSRALNFYSESKQ